MNELDSLARFVLAYKRFLSARLRDYEITLPQYHLVHLARQKGPLTLSAASRELDWRKPATTLIARKCIFHGWITRKGARDLRMCTVSLSGSGEELLDRIEHEAIVGPRSRDYPLALLEEQEIETLARCLEKFEQWTNLQR